jgi:DNA-binding NarL/FixJ family response regulator
LAVLQARGVRVIAEKSPSAAVSLAEVCRPDLVVVGLSMPGMDGLEMVTLLYRGGSPKASVVVLPEPGEGLDPLVCTNNRATGRYSIDHYPSDQIWMRVAELCGLRPEGAPARYDNSTDVAG